MSSTTRDACPTEHDRPPNEAVDARPGAPSASVAPTPSGTRPAAEGPRPAPSGTSGTSNRTSNLPLSSDPSVTVNSHPISTFVSENLPDVPDMGEMPAGRVPDTCRTVPDGARQDGLDTAADSTGGQAAPNGTPQSAGTPSTTRLVALGVLRMGLLRSRRANFLRFENPDLRELLNQDVPPDTVVEAEQGA